MHKYAYFHLVCIISYNHTSEPVLELLKTWRGGAPQPILPTYESYTVNTSSTSRV